MIHAPATATVMSTFMSSRLAKSAFHAAGKTRSPPASVAMAKVSMRLVPNQDPDKIAQLFEAYVKKIAPKSVEVKVTRMHGGKPWMTSFDNQYVQAAGRAIERGFGKTPVAGEPADLGGSSG